MQKTKKRKITRKPHKKEKKMDSKDETEMPKTLKHRSYPTSFSKAVKQLSNAQKEWVRSAGFGDLLEFSLREIPHFLSVNVLWWYDADNRWLNLSDNRVIRVTENDVHQILGLPNGKKEVVTVKDQDELKEWRSQFDRPEEDGHKITGHMILQAMESTREVNLKFKQNFMVLMMNTFIRCIKNSYVTQDLIGFIGDYDESGKYNWCKLVTEGLNEDAPLWLENPHTQYYTGSFVFLLYFYLDRVSNELIKVERTRPGFIAWKNSLILRRNQTEYLDDTFGNGKIISRSRCL